MTTFWEEAQSKEKAFWMHWLAHNENDDEWLNFILSKFNIKENYDFKDETLIDIGSGPIGILTKLKAKERITIEPLDIEPKDKTIKRIKAKGENISLNDNTADSVFLYNVLQHVESPLKVLQEGFRILKPNGAFYILENLYVKTDVAHPNYLTEKLFDIWKLNSPTMSIIQNKIEDNIICLIVTKL